MENDVATVALYFMHSNCGRVRQTLPVTPAMEAGIAGHVWSNRGNCLADGAG
jgi:hypothetical protein